MRKVCNRPGTVPGTAAPSVRGCCSDAHIGRHFCYAVGVFSLVRARAEGCEVESGSLLTKLEALSDPRLLIH